MFCPSCGLEEKQSNQFCRACGSNLNTVRTALERPDGITNAAISARDEIGRAIAFKIREAKSADELAVVAEEVLPEIEKFLESPAEKRLRRVRAGTIISSTGVGVVLMFMLLFANGSNTLFMIGAGVVAFFVGLGIIINGLLFTVSKKMMPDYSSDARRQREIDVAGIATGELSLPESNGVFSSVTEHTTRHLKEKQPVSRGQ
jgi:hypothetical protein